MPYIKSECSNEQLGFLPVCFDDKIAENNNVRVIDAFVNALPICKI